MIVRPIAPTLVNAFHPLCACSYASTSLLKVEQLAGVHDPERQQQHQQQHEESKVESTISTPASTAVTGGSPPELPPLEQLQPPPLRRQVGFGSPLELGWDE